MVPLGIMLIRIVCWASEQLARARRGPADDLLVLAAYVGLAVVTVIGLIVDWLPLKTAAGDKNSTTSAGNTRNRSLNAVIDG